MVGTQSPESSYSFQAADRLRVKAEFDFVFGRPNERYSQGALQAILKESPGSADGCPRLGLVIAKRFLPLAVQRNRVKRLIREGFRHAKGALPAVDIIVRLSRVPQNEVNAGDVAALFGKMQRG